MQYDLGYGGSVVNGTTTKVDCTRNGTVECNFCLRVIYYHWDSTNNQYVEDGSYDAKSGLAACDEIKSLASDDAAKWTRCETSGQDRKAVLYMYQMDCSKVTNATVPIDSLPKTYTVPSS